MLAQKMLMKRKWILVACGSLLAIIALSRFWSEIYYRLTISGKLGCGIANVHVRSGDTTFEIRTGLDTYRLLGSTLDERDLVRRFENRIEMIKSGPEIWRDHKYTRAEYELILAANLLIKINHPRARELFQALLDDPLFVYNADDWLVTLGDAKAAPYLLESWKKRPDYPFVYVNAFKILPYEAAVPHLIEVFRIHMGSDDIDSVFKAIENCSGDDLAEIRVSNLSEHESVESLKSLLQKWWTERQTEANMRLQRDAAKAPRP